MTRAKLLGLCLVPVILLELICHVDWAQTPSLGSRNITLVTQFNVSRRMTTTNHSSLNLNRWKSKPFRRTQSLRVQYGHPGHTNATIRGTRLPPAFKIPPLPPFDKDVYNILGMDPIAYNDSFKNPCWYGSGGVPGIRDDRVIHCLPYFYLIGVKKSGTTDLYSRIRKHPELATGSGKELHWFSRLRWGQSMRMMPERIKGLIRGGADVRMVGFYVSMFDQAAQNVEAQTSRRDGGVFHNTIIGDGTPSTLHLDTNWQLLPGNEDRPEPRFTHLDYIRHLVPQTKIIVIMRDPVARLYSDFLHMASLENPWSARPEVFHDHVVAITDVYNACMRQFSVRHCVYDNSLRQQLIQDGYFLAESFVASFYGVYLSDIYRVFPASHVLPLLTSEYADDMRNILSTVFKFLDIRDLTEKEMKHAMVSERKNTSKMKKAGPMLPRTRSLLVKFFRPHNIVTANFMKDKRYLFLNDESNDVKKIIHKLDVMKNDMPKI